MILHHWVVESGTSCESCEPCPGWLAVECLSVDWLDAFFLFSDWLDILTRLFTSAYDTVGADSARRRFAVMKQRTIMQTKKLKPQAIKS